MVVFTCGHAHVLPFFFNPSFFILISLAEYLSLISASALKQMLHDTH